MKSSSSALDSALLSFLRCKSSRALLMIKPSYLEDNRLFVSPLPNHRPIHHGQLHHALQQRAIERRVAAARVQFGRIDHEGLVGSKRITSAGAPFFSRPCSSPKISAGRDDIATSRRGSVTSPECTRRSPAASMVSRPMAPNSACGEGQALRLDILRIVIGDDSRG